MIRLVTEAEGEDCGFPIEIGSKLFCTIVDKVDDIIRSW
eukprot:CAMPEP_0172299194 /NCGR_PEP_ID=MMETSP1058-20130122/1562_1 /TAXON_ID=83371 /ORGANISM="Detonula confervacea, Strain CCMP 353" /LENGTH=38 /DNA_ID= /DNA_START= /DNA_END= /DNA_ORIENTATION=